MMYFIAFQHLLFIGSLFKVVAGVHVIKDQDEAHHVTRTMLGATGKLHGHLDVEGLRKGYKVMKDSHEAKHGPLKKPHERHEPITAEVLRKRRELAAKGNTNAFEPKKNVFNHDRNNKEEESA